MEKQVEKIPGIPFFCGLCDLCETNVLFVCAPRRFYAAILVNVLVSAFCAARIALTISVPCAVRT